MKLSEPGTPTCFSSLAEDQQGEEHEPEEAHGVPVPGGEVYEDLAVFKLAGDEEAYEGGDEGGYSGEEVEAVDSGDEEEGVGALAGVVVDAGEA